MNDEHESPREYRFDLQQMLQELVSEALPSAGKALTEQAQHAIVHGASPRAHDGNG